MNKINHLLEKYWDANTSIEEEQELRRYFAGDEVTEEHEMFSPLFLHYDTASKVKTDIDVSSIIQDEILKEEAVIPTKKGRVVTLRQYLPAVAAAFIVLLSFVVGMKWYSDSPTVYHNVTVLDEEKEREEAIRITKEALAMLSDNYKKGSDAIMSINHMNKANRLLQ